VPQAGGRRMKASRPCSTGLTASLTACNHVAMSPVLYTTKVPLTRRVSLERGLITRAGPGTGSNIMAIFWVPHSCAALLTMSGRQTIPNPRQEGE
jgi:hypothetical protein